MRLLAAVVGAFALAQLLKLIIASVRARKLTWQVVFFAGGMPSVHAALASSVALGLLLSEGLTALSVAACTFALLFIYDAMTLRRTVAEHHSLLHSLYARLGPKGGKFVRRQGGIGHTPVEVFVGVVIGALFAFAIFRNDVFLVLWLFLPAAAANMMPVVAHKVFGPGRPIHTGLFGSHKTWQGFFWGVLGGGACFALQRLAPIGTFGFPWYFGFLLGFGALLGDLLKSFVKRRVGITPGKPWIPFDQLDYIVGAILVTLPFASLTWEVVAIALVGYGVLVLATNQVSFSLGMRKERL